MSILAKKIKFTITDGNKRYSFNALAGDFGDAGSLPVSPTTDPTTDDPTTDDPTTDDPTTDPTDPTTDPNTDPTDQTTDPDQGGEP